MFTGSRIHVCVGVLTLLAAGGCGRSTSDPSGPPPALTALPRALTANEHTVLDASNAFSFALWGKINATQPDANVFVSPLSASFALGMTLNGAANTTFDQMRSALQFGGAAQGDINDGYKSLIALLTSLDPAVQVQIANSIWYRNTFPFTQSFLDAGKTYFDAQVSPLNFSDAAGSVATINGWVNTKTAGKIPAILAQSDIDDAAVMFLLNAIYFKGGWRVKFDPSETHAASFQSNGGTAQSMQLMHRTAKMTYAETATWQAVELPYGDSAFVMTVLLPRSGVDIAALAASLTPGTWQSIVGSLHVAEVDLSLPRLTLTYERRLNDDLIALGMISAFVPLGADFTRMSPMGNQLNISFVRQKTFVDINELGTEAAAVTAVGVQVTSAPLTYVMRVDHPYLFVLRERLSGTVLFMGKITQMPAAGS